MAVLAPTTRELSADWQAKNQWRRQLVVAALALVGSVVLVYLVLLAQLLSIVALAIWIVLVCIAWRPRIGLYVALALILAFEPGGADQLMLPGAYFHGGLGAMLGLTGVSSSPLELLLILILGIWLVQGLARRRLDFRGGRLGWPVFLFFVAMLIGLVRGLAGGGDTQTALWEVRFLCYTIVAYYLFANTIRTYRQLSLVTGIFMFATAAFAVEGAYRRLFLIDTGKIVVAPEFAFSHDSVIYLGTFLLVVLAQFVFRGPAWQRVLGIAFLPIVGYTLLATERRAGYIAVVIAFLAYAVIFLIAHRKAFFLIVAPMLIAFAIYLPIFWNNTSTIGQPARAVRSLSQPDPRDAASNLYRDLEKINVQSTIRSNPLFGVGFGRQYDFVVPLPDVSWWPFWHYEPHHNILYVWLKTGAIGFILFWVVMGTAISRAAYFVRTLHRPEPRIFALLALGGILMTLTFLYVDLGLRSGRVTVFMGAILGTLSILDQLRDQRSERTA